MNLDKDGLPVQLDGDANDQLNRLGMIIVASYVERDFSQNHYLLNCFHAITTFLQPSPGIYLRHRYGNQRNVSADQLLPILCVWTMGCHKIQKKRMLVSMLKRFGFAQNIVDGLNGDNEKRKIPDFMLFRAMPLFARSFRSAKWRHLWDLYLPIMVISDLIYILLFSKQSDAGVFEIIYFLRNK
jgi:hypothetical protein